MPELGGTTTQSGIYYQNSLAALRLGRLCDMQTRPTRERIVEVRVEAPEAVDDIVVTYADHHHDWMQAKENLSKSDKAWKKLWSDFELQRWSSSFRSDDRINLVVGTHHQLFSDLQEVCLRALSALNHQEWRSRLTIDMSTLVDDIKILMSPEHQNDESLLSLFARLDVEISTLTEIEREDIVRWMPESSEDRLTLFRLLRDRIGGRARHRGTFVAPQLLVELDEDHHIHVLEPQALGIPAYRAALSKVHGQLSVPGTNVSGPVESLFLWPLLQEAYPDRAQILDMEDEKTIVSGEQRGTVDLRQYPHATMPRAIVVGGAGFGKTALLTAIAYELGKTPWLPALVPLIELAESDETVIEFLSNTLNRQYNVSIPWDYFCDDGRAVLLFDGLDELTPRDRHLVLTRIQQFAGRYEQVPWLLTVRDASALSVSIPAAMLQVNTVDDNQIASFATLYRAAGSIIDVDQLLEQIHRYPDLRLLARIPLFLALLLATAKPTDSLPRQRSALLERYLGVTLRPEEFKPSQEFSCTAYELREVAEYLAYVALEHDKVYLADREVHRAIKDLSTRASSNEILDCLAACGLLKRTSTQTSFTFPIVLEYLAACYLVSNQLSTIVRRFELAVRRPWAQTLQFALEQHPEADNAVNELLEQPDDAFNTVLRLITRCIINGAQVSEATRAQVGDKLAEAWVSQSYYHDC